MRWIFSLLVWGLPMLVMGLTFDTRLSTLALTDGKQKFHFEHDGHGNPGESDQNYSNRYFMVELSERVSLGDHWQINLKGAKNLSHTPKDTTQSSRRELDSDTSFYSTRVTRTKGDLLRLEGQLSYLFRGDLFNYGVSFAPLMGFHFSRYHYDLTEDNLSAPGFGDGNSIEQKHLRSYGMYKIEGQTAYLGAHTAIDFSESWRVSLEGGFSPWVRFKDQGQLHTYNQTSVKGDYRKGYFGYLNPKVEHLFKKHWSVSFDLIWQKMSLKGEQMVKRRGEFLAKAKMDSTFVQSGIFVGYQF